ncbi:MAG: peptidylprolyl isomerase [Sphingobium sp.]
MEINLTAVRSGAVRKALLGLAAAAVVASGIPASAQRALDEGEGPTTGRQLDIPDNVTLFGKRDPNVRTATAIVNGSVITATDVDQRLALVLLANSNKVSDEERDRLRIRVLSNIIDETLQIQEAAANDIRVAPAELDQNFARVATNFKSTPEAFANYLKSNGSSAASIRRQIEAEVAWQRVVRRKVQPFINVSEDEVRSFIDRMKESKGNEEFRIGEIYLSATPENGDQVQGNMRNIVEQLKKGGSFQAYARQYSEASTAAVGGDLGWVRPAQLPDELASAVQGMQPGQLAGPIPLPGGFSIVYLIDKRRVLSADPRDAVLSLKQIGVNFPAGTTAPQAKVIADKFAAQIKEIQGCGTADAVAKKIGADVVNDDGVQARNLPPQLQEIVLSMQVGQATPPYGAVSDGVRVLVLCGRDEPTEGALPSFDQVMGQMEDERVNKRSLIYMRDLRRDAVIEYN